MHKRLILRPFVSCFVIDFLRQRRQKINDQITTRASFLHGGHKIFTFVFLRDATAYTFIGLVKRNFIDFTPKQTFPLLALKINVAENNKV
jgi:hypothetical protein